MVTGFPAGRVDTGCHYVTAYTTNGRRERERVTGTAERLDFRAS